MDPGAISEMCVACDHDLSPPDVTAPALSLALQPAEAGIERLNRAEIERVVKVVCVHPPGGLQARQRHQESEPVDQEEAVVTSESAPGQAACCPAEVQG